MKKIILFAAAVLAFASCSKQEPQTEIEKHLTLNFTINNGTPTKAGKTGWEAGDVVYIFFQPLDTRTEIEYLALEYDGSKWSETWTSGLETEIAGTTSGTLTAVYCPGGINIENFYIWSGHGYSVNGTKDRMYLSAEKVSYTVSGGMLSATLDMYPKRDWVNFVLKGIPEAEAGNWTVACTNILQSCFAGVRYDGSISRANGDIGGKLPGFMSGGDLVFGGVIYNSTYFGQERDYTVTVVNNKGTSDTSDDVTYTKTFTKIINQYDQIILPDPTLW